MNRLIKSAIIAFALGTMAAAQAPVPPAPPAAPAAPATPAPAMKPRPAPAPAPKVKGSSYLGVDVRDVTHENMAGLKVKEPRGVEVLMVDRDAPAGKAGLKEHDVILSFNGRNIQTSEELRKLIRETPSGQTVELGISRGGQPMTLKAQLADRRRVYVVKSPEVRVRIPHVEVPAVMVYRRRHGIVIENLTPQLGEVFGVKNGEGVLVRSVEKDSPGEAAGLRAGDVIVRVGNERVADASEWTRLMRDQKPGPVQLGIVRDKRQQTLSMTVPEHPREQTFVMRGLEDFDVEDFTHEMERVRPEIERAMREAQETVRREMERSRREMERAQRESERAQRDAERAQRDAEREQERAQREAERERERAQREAERAQERAKRDLEKAAPPATPPPPSKPPQ